MSTVCRNTHSTHFAIEVRISSEVVNMQRGPASSRSGKALDSGMRRRCARAPCDNNSTTPFVRARLFSRKSAMNSQCMFA